MSRHAQFNNALRRDDFDDDYDDDLSSSYGSVSNSYTQSPTTAGYLFNRQNDTLTKSVDGVAKLDDSDLLRDLIPAVFEVVNPKFSREDVVAALRDNDYVVSDAIRHLAEQEPFMEWGASVEGRGGGAVFDMDEEDVGPPPGFEAAKKSTANAGEPLSDVGRLLAAASQQRPNVRPPDSFSSLAGGFAFTTPSPDDVVLAARNAAKKGSATVPPAKTPIKGKQAAAATPAKKGGGSSSSNNNNKSGGMKKSQELNKSQDGGRAALKGSSSGVVAVAATNLKTSTDAGKKVLPMIRPEKKTKQLLDDMQQELAASKNKMSMVVIGHVDAGKSTLVGHLLHLLGCVDDRTMHKNKKTAEAEGKGSFHFAWVMDASDEERKRGVTIDVGLGHFETQSKSVTLLDAPGHLDFVPNMIMGAAQAEAALLVVDCTPNNFESGFSAGGQTREHALLARSLGVKQVIVVVNKMDSVGWSEQRFAFVREEISQFLTKQAGFRAAQLQFVPLSGFKGVNITDCKEPALSSWYSGPPLVTVIDKLPALDRDLSKPTRFYVTEVLGRGEVIGVSGLGLSGKVESGIVAVGDNLLLLPVGQVATVKSLKLSNGMTCQSVGEGESIEMGVVGHSDDGVFGVGDVLCDPQKPVQIVRKFRAQIVVFQPPRPLLKGDQFILHTHAATVQCRLSRLRAIVDKKTGEVEQRRPRLLPHRATAIVDIRLDRPMCMELFQNSQQLGRFMLRTSSKTCAAGVITSMLSVGLKKHKQTTEGDEKKSEKKSKK